MPQLNVPFNVGGKVYKVVPSGGTLTVMRDTGVSGGRGTTQMVPVPSSDPVFAQVMKMAGYDQPVQPGQAQANPAYTPPVAAPAAQPAGGADANLMEVSKTRPLTLEEARMALGLQPGQGVSRGQSEGLKGLMWRDVGHQQQLADYNAAQAAPAGGLPVEAASALMDMAGTVRGEPVQASGGGPAAGKPDIGSTTGQAGAGYTGDLPLALDAMGAGTTATGTRSAEVMPSGLEFLGNDPAWMAWAAQNPDKAAIAQTGRATPEQWAQWNAEVRGDAPVTSALDAMTTAAAAPPQPPMTGAEAGGTTVNAPPLPEVTPELQANPILNAMAPALGVAEALPEKNITGGDIRQYAQDLGLDKYTDMGYLRAMQLAPALAKIMQQQQQESAALDQRFARTPGFSSTILSERAKSGERAGIGAASLMADIEKGINEASYGRALDLYGVAQAGLTGNKAAYDAWRQATLGQTYGQGQFNVNTVLQERGEERQSQEAEKQRQWAAGESALSRQNALDLFNMQSKQQEKQSNEQFWSGIGAAVVPKVLDLVFPQKQQEKPQETDWMKLLQEGFKTGGWQ